jgi:hypothetical protein
MCSPAREELEQATVRVKLFREQPTSELARSATATDSATTALTMSTPYGRNYHCARPTARPRRAPPRNR